MTYRVPVENMRKLREKFDKINRRAERLGCPPVELKRVGAESENCFEAGVKAIRHYAIVEVIGVAPQIDGWTFVGVIDHAGEVNVLRLVPGETAPEEYRTAAPVCDHCGTRRMRNMTYVLRKGDDHKQVGSSCLQDFLGHDPHQAAAYAGLLFDAVEMCESFMGMGHVSGWALDQYLAHVSYAIRSYGWVSRAQAENYLLTATADTAMARMLDLRHSDLDGSDLELAEKAIEWAKGFGEDVDDYKWNLHAVAENGYVTSRTAGLAASMIPAYLRELERQRQAKASTHFGVVGERGRFELTLTGEVQGIYGGRWTSYLHRFVDADGNIAVWFSSKPTDLEPNRTYKIEARVKGHDVYKGVPQTVLTRCKIA